MDQTIDYAIELDPGLRQLLPGGAVPGHGRSTRRRCAKGCSAGRATGRRWNTRTTCCAATGSTSAVVMDAINRAKRRFFLRPRYIARHAGDVARLALTKQSIVWQVLTRTVFGTRVVDTAVPGSAPRRPSLGSERQRRDFRGRQPPIGLRREAAARETNRPQVAQLVEIAERFLEISSCSRPRSGSRTRTAARRPTPGARAPAARGRS